MLILELVFRILSGRKTVNNSGYLLTLLGLVLFAMIVMGIMIDRANAMDKHYSSKIDDISTF